MSESIIPDPKDPNPGDLIEGLLAQFGNPEGLIDVELPDGKVLQFRNVRSSGELIELQTQAAAFAKASLQRGGCPVAWRELGELTPYDLVTAYMLSELSVEPKFEQLHVLRLCMGAPWLIDHITQRINAKRMRYLVQTGEQIEVSEEKKDSPETTGSEPS